VIFDFCIIGAGIVGLSTAMQLQQRFQHASIVLLEKESAPALHQTGRNSGVIHAGVYYAPGSLKARFCREGSARTMAFCRENSIPYEQCGKLIVATSNPELARLGDLETRARANGLEPIRLDGEQLAEREPDITGLGALLFRETGIVDYGAVCRGMASRFITAGGEIRFGAVCTGFKEHPGEVEIHTDGGTLHARSVITCAGVQSDRMARLAGLDIDFRIVPFRGDYFRLRSERNAIIRHLIYPVPDPALPFLGVHLTRMIGGYVTVGPNAALSFAREGYGRLSLNVVDSIDLATFPGFWRTIWNNRASAVDELHSAFSRRRYLALCQKYCPSLTLEDLEPHPSGIRAQAVKADGTLIHDFLIVQTPRTTHVCNAPSPAATAALPIGAHIVDTVAEKLGRSR
jgi:L-2-hydroxyglutarate oxidase